MLCLGVALTVHAQGQDVTPTRDATGDNPPTQPTNLQTSATHDSVSLTWEASSDQTVTHYAVLRRNRDTDALGVFQVIDGNAGSGTSYTDASVSAESKYGYRVKAVSPTGVSRWSGFVKADTPAAPEPTATPTPTATPEPTTTPTPTPTPTPEPEPASEPDPASLAAANLTAGIVDGGVSLSWDAPAQDADSVTGYEILRAQGGAELTTLVADTQATATAYIDSTATEPGESYAYRVIALRNGENSQQSNRAAVQLPNPLLLAPSNLTAEIADDGVALSWDAPAQDPGSVTGYEVARNVAPVGGSAPLAEVIATGSAATYWVDTNANEPGRALHSYMVRALRDGDESGWSNMADIWVENPPAGDPAPGDPVPGDPVPGDPMPGDPAPGDADLPQGEQFWSATLTPADDGNGNHGYHTGGDGGGELSPATLTWQDAEFTVRSLLAGKNSQLTFRVSAGDWKLDRAASEVAYGELGFNYLLWLGGSAFDFADATVNFRHHYDKGRSYAGYVSYSWPDAGLDWSAGEPVAVSLRQVSLPQQPTGVVARAVAHGMVALSWDDPEDPGVTGYRISRRTGSGAEFQVIEADTGSPETQYTDAAVAPETGYVYLVQGINADGMGPPSGPTDQVTTPAGPADLAPANLTAGFTDGVGVSLSWDAPAKDSGSVTGYEVSRSFELEPGITSVDLTPTGAVVTGWVDHDANEPGVRYTYRVLAVRDGEKSGWSNAAHVDLPGKGATNPGKEPSKAERQTGASVSICDRTWWVRDRLLELTPSQDTCNAVSEVELAAIETLDFPGISGGTFLKAGAFDGLTGLTELDLSGVGIAVIEVGDGRFSGQLRGAIFAGLDNLETLRLRDNKLFPRISDDAFEGLGNLRKLDLRGFSRNPAGKISGLGKCWTDEEKARIHPKFPWDPRGGTPMAFAPLTSLETYNVDADFNTSHIGGYDYSPTPPSQNNYVQPAAAPQNLQLFRRGEDYVLSWDAPTGESDITGYRIERDLNDQRGRWRVSLPSRAGDRSPCGLVKVGFTYYDRLGERIATTGADQTGYTDALRFPYEGHQSAWSVRYHVYTLTEDGWSLPTTVDQLTAPPAATEPPATPTLRASAYLESRSRHSEGLSFLWVETSLKVVDRTDTVEKQKERFAEEVERHAEDYEFKADTEHRRIRLSWTPADPSVTSYEIQYRRSPSAAWQTIVADSGNVGGYDYEDDASEFFDWGRVEVTHLAFVGVPADADPTEAEAEQMTREYLTKPFVHPGRQYRVRAINSVGEGAWSEAVTPSQ